MIHTVTVTEGAAGERLDVYLAAALELPRSQVQKLIKAGRVSVNGAPGKASYPVEAGDSVAAEPHEAPAAVHEAPALPVVYEDEDILVVDKPAGLAVHAGAAVAGATVADFARPRTTDTDAERPGIVHRLDKDTSGLLVIAKHPAAKAYMQAAFKDRQIHKTYHLLAVGRLTPEAAVVKLPIGRDPARPLQQAVVPGGRPAVTAYQVERDFTGFSLVTARPQTGRTHQIRVHFAALGHPVAGDTTYGSPRRPLNLKRQFLHAAELQFTSPSGKSLKLHSPLPPELRRVLDQLEAAEAHS